MYNREREVNRMNYTYILKCSDGTYYTGWTNDMAKRLKTHNEGKGAKYTRARLPVTLAYYEAFETKEEAMRREWRCMDGPGNSITPAKRTGRLSGK